MQRLFYFTVLLFLFAFAFLQAQDTLIFTAKYLPDTNKTLAFVPANGKIPLNGYPLLYLLHGFSGNSPDWNNHTHIQDFADKYGFIIVCPSGYYSSWYLDSPFLENNQYRFFFANNLVPAIHKKYKIDSSNVFITGLSMGGQGAINLFLDNQEYFKSAGSMSGILDITAFPKSWGLDTLVGNFKEYPQNWEKYSCVQNLKKIKNKKKSIIVDCGTEDFAYPVNVKFKNMADSLGVNLNFSSRPGKHEWDYWVKSLTMHMDFFKKLIN